MNDADLIQKFVSVEQRLDKLELYLTLNNYPKFTNSESTSKKQSIKEFLITKKINNDVERTLAIAYFVENNDPTHTFCVEDLKKAFRQARETLPININDKINMNIKKGLIMEAEEKKDSRKAWVLTTTGETFVKDNLNK